MLMAAFLSLSMDDPQHPQRNVLSDSGSESFTAPHLQQVRDV